MGSARLGMVTAALASGVGLVALKNAAEEKAAAERQWTEALAQQRETWAGEREGRQMEHAETIEANRNETRLAERESDNDRRVEEAKLTAKRHEEILGQGSEQFDIKRADAAEEALFKRIDARYKMVQDELEDAKMSMIEGAEDEINARFIKETDRMIEAHVTRLGERGAPGYEIDNAGAFESKLIQMGMAPGTASRRTNALAPQLWPLISSTEAGPGGIPYAPGQPEVGGEPLPETSVAATPSVTKPGSPGIDQKAAASSPAMKVDMLGDKGTVPPAGPDDLYQPGVEPPWGIKAAGGVNSFVDWMKQQGSPQGR